MICNYNNHRNERIVISFFLPFVLGILGLWGTNTANKISEAKNKSDAKIALDHNKASILREFLPILINGKSGEKIIARIALKPYFNEVDWKEFEWGLREQIEKSLYESLLKGDVNSGVDALASYKSIFPDLFIRLESGKIHTKVETTYRKLLNEKIKTLDGKKLFDKILDSTK